MAKIAQNLKGLNAAQKAAKGDTATTAAGTANGIAVLGTPAPTEVAGLATATTALKDAIAANAAADLASKTATSAQLAAEAAFVIAYGKYARVGDNKCDGDPVKIGYIGMDVASAKAPIGEMPQVLNLVATMGDLVGEVDLMWEPVHGSVSFIIQWCTDPIVEANWKQFDITKKSKITVTGLTSGQKYWFRVCAKGTALGQGPWSDPATKMAT